MQLLRDIALFVEVVNTKSFTQAALHLEMPASTLSRRIRGLEEQIGLRLLNRTTRRVEVTEAGAAYYAKCAHLVEEARIAHEDLVERTTQARGTLRLSCSADFASHYLPDVLTEFTIRYPHVNVELDLTSRMVDLIAENIDAALRIGKLPDSNLVGRRIAQLQPILVASPEYLIRAPVLAAPIDLRHHMCIRMNSRESGSRWELRRKGAEESQTVIVKGRFTLSSVSLIKKLASRGAGIAIVDSALVQDEIESGKLYQVLPHWSLSPVDLNLLTPSRFMPARVRLFSDLLLETLSTLGAKST
jgi:DNA-binding transcriptional LysR family regulator